MFFVARAYAETGRLADAYGPGSGLTAHVTPIMPILAGLVYRLTGVGTPAGAAALTLISIVLVGIGIVALNLVAAALDPAAWQGWRRSCSFRADPDQLPSGDGRVPRLGGRGGDRGDGGGSGRDCFAWTPRPSEPSWLGMGAIAAVGGAAALLSPPAAPGDLRLRLGLLQPFASGAFLPWSPWRGSPPSCWWRCPTPGPRETRLSSARRCGPEPTSGLNFALAFHDGAVNPERPAQGLRRSAGRGGSAYESSRAGAHEGGRGRTEVLGDRDGRDQGLDRGASDRRGDHRGPPPWETSISRSRVDVVDLFRTKGPRCRRSRP